MLPPAQTLANEILALPASPIPLTGITAFVGVITSYMANVQGGPTGLPGIFTLNSALVIAAMTAMKPVTDNSWISSFADAMEDGIVAAIITPGTVTEPVWVTSVTDVSTLPLGASTITTIAAAKAKLISDLNTASTTLQFAQSIYDATLEFTFTCIGLGPLSVPIPLPISAE
jgi:hypothetical protein